MKLNKTILEVINLKKSYNNYLALNKINFMVGLGEFVVILGPNGAGKSTLFSILSGMLAADEGDCLINGFSTKVNQVKALRNLGIVFQQPTIDMELSVIENLHFHSRLHGLRTNNVKNEIHHELKLNRIEKKIHNKVKSLSGGERRKVELIRSLIHKPKILLMDEPTVGLDPNSRKELLCKILDLKIKKKLSILWATHLVDEAENADKIIILNKGKILFFGGPKKLCRKTCANTLAKAYFNIIGEKNENN